MGAKNNMSAAIRNPRLVRLQIICEFWSSALLCKKASGRCAENQFRTREHSYPPLPHGRGSDPNRSRDREGAVDIHARGRSIHTLRANPEASLELRPGGVL
jgi:hypothetical protein